ncbi:hypothetical protein CK203_088719 [Vitis vinifera]|uniref:Uncharacterized protein n=1 Tax=Vitis vinifera TaxID=29760 RepID=A0A438D470_VITVI|nr:hypothetical protein CK203_088719 [Vitis vinifera]
MNLKNGTKKLRRERRWGEAVRLVEEVGWMGGRFGWSNDDHFWQEAQQASLAILGIIIMYLIIAKGEVLLLSSSIHCCLLCGGTRNGFNFIISRILQKVSPATHTGLDNMPKKEVYTPVSAKRV